jgi:hypothetical protein
MLTDGVFKIELFCHNAEMELLVLKEGFENASRSLKHPNINTSGANHTPDAGWSTGINDTIFLKQPPEAVLSSREVPGRFRIFCVEFQPTISTLGNQPKV